MGNKDGKIAAPNESKIVTMKKSGGRSENITLVIATNARRHSATNDDLQRNQAEWRSHKRGPEDTIFETSLKGYIDCELFYTWIVKFIASIPPRLTVLLLLDGHASALSRETLLLARENNVHFLMPPPPHYAYIPAFGCWWEKSLRFARNLWSGTRENT